jgi:hypothetical protein
MSGNLRESWFEYSEKAGCGNCSLCSAYCLKVFLYREEPPGATFPADHVEDFVHHYSEELNIYCADRMPRLGIPDRKIGESEAGRPGSWRAFVPEERTGGYSGVSITVNSGVLNPDLLKGQKGSREWVKASLRDRIDAIIAHEFEEDRLLDHWAAVEAAADTESPVTDGARRILRAMAR